MAEVKYSGVNKGEDNRYKINNNILRMMNTNPALGTGYLIGSMLGENYWGRKRAKTRQGVKDAWDKQNGSVGADANGTYGTSKEPNYYDNMNKALDEYKNNPNGKVLYSGSSVQTPQQANKPAVTTENAGNGGGVPGVMDAWNNMNNASMYNAGNTAMYTNGARNLGNVIGADANGLIGVSPAAPSAANIPRSPQTAAPNPNPTPIPYTAEQLQQIRDYGGFTPEELRRAGAEAAIPQAPVSVAVPTEASDPSGGVLTAIANNAQASYTPNEIRGLEGNVPADGAPNLEVINTASEPVAVASNQVAAQPKLPGYKSAIDWNEVRQAQPTFGVNVPKVFNYVVDPKNPSWLDKYLG